MSVDGVKEAILAAVRQRCPLKNNNESSAAARAIRYYMGEEVAELEWGRLPRPRINKIEDAVVAAVQAHYRENHDAQFPSRAQARITAQFMRRTPALGARAGSHRPAGTRPSGGGVRSRKK